MQPSNDLQLILGNANQRFSGVTSTMLQVLNYQQSLVELAVLGKHHVSETTKTLNFREFVRLSRRQAKSGQTLVFHARRNDEMIQALIAKWLGANIKIAFTSTAQRHHSAFTRWLMSQMDAIISTCNAAASYLQTPPDIIIPHGVDTDRFQPPADKSQAWQALGFPGKIGIGVFGRVRHSKGIDVLIDAAIRVLPQHPDVTVIICGECLASEATFQQTLVERLQQHQLENRVLFIGKQPFERLPELFRGMSIVAALSREEGFGLTPLEAMASGAAVLTSHAGAWPDVVQPGVQGYLSRTGDADDVATKLDALLSDHAQTTAMGQAGRIWVEQHYSVKREAEQLTEFLLSLV